LAWFYPLADFGADWRLPGRGSLANGMLTSHRMPVAIAGQTSVLEAAGAFLSLVQIRTGGNSIQVLPY